MLIIPDAETAFMDPFMEYPTISLICNIVDPITKEQYTRTPDTLRRRRRIPEVYRIGDTAYFGPRQSSHLRRCPL